MARTITAAALAELSNQYGVEPVTIIEIEWIEGTITKYADKKLTSENIEGNILVLGSLDEVINLLGSGNTVTLDVTLDDTKKLSP